MQYLKFIITTPFYLTVFWLGIIYLSIFGKDEDFYRPDDL